LTKNGLGNILAILSQTHLVTLILAEISVPRETSFDVFVVIFGVSRQKRCILPEKEKEAYFVNNEAWPAFCCCCCCCARHAAGKPSKEYNF
jgi:hypothetical protein